MKEKIICYEGKGRVCKKERSQNNQGFKKEDDEIKEIKRKLKEINDKKGMDEGEKEKENKILKCYKMKRKEKVIKRKDVIENFHVVLEHACRALEHLNKRYKRNALQIITSEYTK
ncbi:hypothetical protein RclHR1_00020016 [Rhizophagus clarus]|uniref:Uncharacterized protein n=1 Tax=Rhizophagus clarus TaxID=94130 RepID=A0A2Z6QPK4_9GLOM|nr:hypothetical protein RclHR1_00020016 [Rhizophagus clarus]GES84538.1 hypothetical protein GLOIN_2v1769896 [Rhizophagus clarus]